MSPQPLSKVRKEGEVTITPLSVYSQPHLAGLVMQLVGIWAYTEYEFTALAANFLKADFQVVTDMLNALRGGEARKDAIRAAAKSALPSDDFKLFQAVERVVKPSRDRRNEYVHHVWGWCPELTDALLLVDPRYLATLDAQVAEKFMGMTSDSETPKALVTFLPKAMQPDHTAKTTSPIDIDRSKVFVYRFKDIEDDLTSARMAAIMALQMRYVFSDDPTSDQRRTWLLSRPEVQQHLQPTSSENDP